VADFSYFSKSAQQQYVSGINFKIDGGLKSRRRPDERYALSPPPAETSLVTGWQP